MVTITFRILEFTCQVIFSIFSSYVLLHITAKETVHRLAYDVKRDARCKCKVLCGCNNVYLISLLHPLRLHRYLHGAFGIYDQSVGGPRCIVGDAGARCDKEEE